MLCSMCQHGTTKFWRCTCGESNCNHMLECTKCQKRRYAVQKGTTVPTLKFVNLNQGDQFNFALDPDSVCMKTGEHTYRVPGHDSVKVGDVDREVQLRCPAHTTLYLGDDLAHPLTEQVKVLTNNGFELRISVDDYGRLTITAPKGVIRISLKNPINGVGLDVTSV
jgi:hypothetical protein